MTELKWHPSLENPYVLLWDGREIARIENNSVEFMQFSTMMDKIPFGEYTDPKIPRRLLAIARRTLELETIKKKKKKTPSSDLVQKIIRFCSNKKVMISRHYSGRYMFGKECIGFIGTDIECITVAEIIKRKTGKSYCSDNLGLDMIYYFPDIEDNREQ